MNSVNDACCFTCNDYSIFHRSSIHLLLSTMYIIPIAMPMVHRQNEGICCRSDALFFSYRDSLFREEVLRFLILYNLNSKTFVGDRVGQVTAKRIAGTRG
jgi:hypothetical protein